MVKKINGELEKSLSYSKFFINRISIYTVKVLYTSDIANML